jgi:hypothetical protein
MCSDFLRYAQKSLHKRSASTMLPQAHPPGSAGERRGLAQHNLS